MDALLVVFIISIIVRAISRNKNKDKRGSAVEEQRARREAYQAAQQQVDQREHPWQSPPGGTGVYPPTTQQERPIQQPRPIKQARPIQQERPIQQARPIQKANTSPAQQTQTATQAAQKARMSSQLAQKPVADVTKTIPIETAQMFGNGFSREELIKGIIMSEVLSAPRAKKPLHS